MNEIHDQMMEIIRITDENDLIYHQIASEFGLSDTVHWIFYILDFVGKPLTQKDLCNALSASKQTINTSVSSMRKAGWVELTPYENSKKVKAITLTEAGKDICQAIMNVTRKIEENALAKIPATDREVFISVYRQLNLNMKEEMEKIIPQKG